MRVLWGAHGRQLGGQFAEDAVVDSIYDGRGHGNGEGRLRHRLNSGLGLGNGIGREEHLQGDASQTQMALIPHCADCVVLVGITQPLSKEPIVDYIHLSGDVLSVAYASLPFCRGDETHGSGGWTDAPAVIIDIVTYWHHPSLLARQSSQSWRVSR